MTNNRLLTKKQSSIRIENLVISSIKIINTSLTEKALYDITDVVLHQHSNAELFFCTKGTMVIHTEDCELSLNEGEIAIIPPALKHITHIGSAETICRAVLFTCEKLATKNCRDLYSEIGPLVFCDTVKIFKNLPTEQKVIAEKMMTKNFSNDYIHALLIAELLLFLKTNNFKDDITKIANDFSDMNRSYILDDIISSKFTENIKLSDVAKTLFLSEKQVSRIVKKYYGKTLYKVIVDKRIDAAEQLLNTTDMSLLQISTTVGFSSVTVFAKEFIRKHGITPKEFKKNNIQK